MRLHLFNPETEYALASGNASYTPSKIVAQMASRLSLFPVFYAEKGDGIIIRDNADNMATNRILLESAYSRGIRIIPAVSLRDLSRAQENIEITPWGWNHNLRKWLFDKGVSGNLLPEEKSLLRLRELAHRRTTIEFHRHIGSPDIFHPKEFLSSEEAIEFVNAEKNVCLKAPWSSSGRGIFFTAGLNRATISQRITGVIRNQGSIMAERSFRRILDFGSEWDYFKGKAYFKGYSPLFVSERGKYIYNLIVSNDDFINDIFQKFQYGSKANDIDLTGIAEKQKEALEKTIGNDYDGPVGIDMFITSEYDVNPCVEINFRRTMGRVALDIAEKFISGEDSLYNSFIESVFPDKKLDLNRII